MMGETCKTLTVDCSSLHRLPGLHIIKKHFEAVLPRKIESVHKEGRFARLVEGLAHADLVHPLVVDEECDAVQVASVPIWLTASGDDLNALVSYQNWPPVFCFVRGMSSPL